MANYEAMFIVKPDLNEEQQKEFYAQLNDCITKNNGEVVESKVWSERRRLAYPIKKSQDGIYYLISFKAEAKQVLALKQVYRLNENILRLLVLRKG